SFVYETGFGTQSECSPRAEPVDRSEDSERSTLSEPFSCCNTAGRSACRVWGHVSTWARIRDTANALPMKTGEFAPVFIGTHPLDLGASPPSGRTGNWVGLSLHPAHRCARLCQLPQVVPGS